VWSWLGFVGSAPLHTQMASEAPAKVSLHVSGLPVHANEGDIRELFERFGPVRDVYRPRDHFSGRVSHAAC
jgi:RNA recognition motif-containing protein